MVKVKTIVAGIGIAVGVYLILSFITSTGIFERGPAYVTFSEIPITLEEMARTSDVIVLGKVGSTLGVEHFDNGKIKKATATMYVDIEKELTGNYKDKRITIKTFGDGKTLINQSVQLKEGERVLLFLRYSDSDWDGEDGYVVSVTSQKFSIDSNDIAYNPHFGSYKLDELISIIEKARAERIKDIAINSAYAVIGKVKSIEKTVSSEDEDYKYLTSRNVTVEIDMAIPDYKEKEITFYVWDIDDIKGCIGEDKVCLYFIKYGTKEEFLQGSEDKEHENVAEYYLYSRVYIKDGVYKIVDNKAYGIEYPEGIELDELIERIRVFKGVE